MLANATVRYFPKHVKFDKSGHEYFQNSNFHIFLAKGRDNGGEPRAAFCYHLSTHGIRCYNRNAMLLEHAAHGRFASANPACQTIHCHTIGSFVDLYSSLLRCHPRL